MTDCMKKKWNIWIVILLWPLLTYSQNEANTWYFGNGAGLDFNSTPPTLLQNGNAGLLTFTGEGVGSISDASGVLQFYTNGNIVYNRNHLAMPNGTGLNGNGTTTQTGVIVPMPGSSTQYYVFSPSDANNPVKYSVVDMTLDGGLGDVVVASKNTTLLANASESAVVIPHDNGIDYWVIFHASTVNTYHVFALTSGGITGPTNYNIGGAGQATMLMKTNSCFNKIASSFYNFGRVDVVNFDNITGVISAAGMITLSGTGAGNAFNAVEVYGIEFSPNGRFLYVSESGLNGRDDIHQFDLQAGSAAAITASRRTHTGGSTDRAGALQLGPDGKIYMPGYTTAVPAYLSVIPSPNTQWAASPPTATEFEYMKYTFTSKRVGEGLPPVLKNLLTSLRIFYNNACEGAATNFSFIFGSAVSPAPGSIVWDFGDGSPNTIDQLAPSHTYAAAGTYTATLTVIDICGKTRTGTVNVIVKSGPTYTFAGGCPNTNIVITGTGTNSANYTWSANASGTPILATGSSYTYNGPLPATVYVQDPTPLASYVTGNTITSGHFASNTGYVYFDVNTTLKLTSFKVMSRTSGTGTFTIRDAATATTVYWGPQVCSPTAAGQLFTYTPNVTLAPGSYVLYVTTADDAFEKQNGSNGGGRDVNGVISVLGEKNGTRGGLFYDIEVALPDPCGIRAIPIPYNCPSPVTLLDFYGHRSGEVIKLFWEVANEVNNDYFLIERSSDGINFEVIGRVEGRGTTNEFGSYTFTDPSALSGVSYYRLAQVDYDGKVNNSPVITFRENKNPVVVFPNPFTDELSVYSLSDEKMEIEIVDITGRTVFRKTKEFGESSVQIDGVDLSKGTYILKLLEEDVVSIHKIVKE